jgi:ankyrin repeat protein
LHLAVKKERDDLCKLMLEAQAHLEARYSEGYTPLHVAAMSQNSVIVRRLLDAGAHVNAKALKPSVPDMQTSALHIAARLGNNDIVRILLEKGAEVNAKDRNGREEPTPLCDAAQGGHFATAQLLVASGAEIFCEPQATYIRNSKLTRSQMAQLEERCMSKASTTASISFSDDLSNYNASPRFHNGLDQSYELDRLSPLAHSTLST